MSNTLDGAALLEKHNPILLLYPQEPKLRSRPGARFPGRHGWGDYHPCSVEFFLARIHQRDRPPPYDLRNLFRRWEPLERTGLPALQHKLGSVSPEDSRDWELDVAGIPSQSERRAWRTYGELLDETQEPYECVVYGRYVVAESGPALQYWYLYIYNDFRNNHEADWEMSAIELASDGTPVQMGLSSHHGGSRCSWADVLKDGDRPLLYVARGSHAGYFKYDRRGYHALQLRARSNPPRALKFLVSVLQRLPGIRRWRDSPPTDPERDGDANPKHMGQRVNPELRFLPDSIDQAPDSDWWWLRYRGTWGSTHPRIAGTIGIGTPWGRAGQDPRWADPVAWTRSLRDESA